MHTGSVRTLHPRVQARAARRFATLLRCTGARDSDPAAWRADAPISFDPESGKVMWREIRAAVSLLALLVLFAAPAPTLGQQSNHPLIQRALDAYFGGELERAESALDSLEGALGRPDRANVALLRGLIAYTRNDQEQAREQFGTALDELPSLRLDPDRHSPARVQLFLEVRDERVDAWRVEASTAEARGDREGAVALWTAVLAASPNDPVARAGLDRLAEREPSSEPRRAQATPPPAPPPPPAVSSERDSTPVRRETEAGRTASPVLAAALGMVMPGAGELYVQRPLRGLAVMGIAGGAAAAGLLIERLEQDCRSIPQDGVCPPEDILDERRTKPYRAAGLAVAALITVLGAVDAALTARSGTLSNAASSIDVSPDGRVRFTLLRVPR